MDAAQQSRADELLEEALARTRVRDPRDFCRERLRAMKSANPAAYDQAVKSYEEELIPSIAARKTDALTAWQEYGCRLAELQLPGKPVEVDPTGRTYPCLPPTPHDRMILYIPEGTRTRALVLGLPSKLSPAQEATHDLLVAGRRQLRD